MIKYIVLGLVVTGGLVARAEDLNLKTLRAELAAGRGPAYIESLSDDPSSVCALYDRAVRELYWAEKGAGGLVLVGRAGLEYCLARDLKSEAKTLAYNVAANTWPGWGDEGVVISPTDVKAGVEAARLNLQLAFELDKPADKVAGAHWLLGVLEWASGDLVAAGLSLARAETESLRGGDAAQTGMIRGFAALVAIARGEAEAEARLASAQAELTALGNDDAVAYLAQLETARRMLQSSVSPSD